MVNQLEILGLALGGGAAQAGSEDAVIDGIARALDAVRRHLGMDIAFISEFSGEERTLHYVSTASDSAPIQVGQRIPMDRGYCRKVVDGEIPQLIADTGQLPSLKSIPDTILLPIGSHMSVPIVMADGSIYGTLCCLSAQANPSLNDRDLHLLRAVAELVALQIASDVANAKRKQELLDLVGAAIAAGDPAIVYQPIFELTTGQVVGAEALSRFSQLPYRTPDRWFADAGTVGMRSELEIIAIRNAIRNYTPVWNHDRQRYLTVNASASTLTERDLLSELGDVPFDRMVIEITEHDQIDDYNLLQKSLAPLRERGVRIAVDDAGSGYASLRHILHLRPEVIKLDISLTREIDRDPMRRALAAAIVEFARQTGCKMLAEGIETHSELKVMTELGVQLGQGFLLGKPADVEAMVDSWDR